ncbi:MAG: STM3941 family protein [Alistipes putredinis]
MKKETAIYPSHRKLLGTTLAAAIMTTLSCLLVIVQPHGKVGLVIGIVGAVFFGGCICILFIVLLKNFFRNRPTLLLTPDSLRIYVPAKGIYITIEWQRIADFSVFRTYGQKFIRIELHDPDRAIDEEKTDCQRAYVLAMKAWIPYAITASTVDIGTGGTRKNPAGVFTGIPRKIRCELTDPPAKAVLRADPAYRRKYARTVRQ